MRRRTGMVAIQYGGLRFDMVQPGNIAEFREVARKRLPAPIFDYLEGGADDEESLNENVAAYRRVRFNPQALVDVSSINLATTLLGQRTPLPILLSPTGMSRLFHRDKEPAVARAAAAAGVFYSLSTLATTTLEAIAEATGGPKMFQVYIFKDRDLTREFVRRCRDVGYQALCLTIDTPMAGNRERDRRSGMTIPPRLSPSSYRSFLARPGWVLDYMRSPDLRLANVAHRAELADSASSQLIDYVNRSFDRSVTWDDAAWLAQEWCGPFVVKGISSVEDALRARDLGATGIMISNHGGRQLDGAPAPVDLIQPIREAVGPGLELIVDGGIRRGGDIVKALCLGANACSIGRPYLYGLAAAGQAGVTAVLDILRAEMVRTMTLLGRPSIASLDPSALLPRNRDAEPPRGITRLQRRSVHGPNLR